MHCYRSKKTEKMTKLDIKKIGTFIYKKMTNTDKTLKLDFSEKNSCGHKQASRSVGACFFFKLYVISDGCTNFFCSFLSHSLSNTYSGYSEMNCYI